MATIREIIDGTPRPALFVLRAPRPGDLGWVVHRHGALYVQEYGWDDTFEALVARIVADYSHDHDQEREAAWIAEAEGEQAGFLMVNAEKHHSFGHDLVGETWRLALG